ncbi:hypothetical protein DXG03_007141 [Asterophora parasitica]|uniref:Transmembrane protein n=1 Tax=Asterophora parasitica TaxID=117018 RepID=A0A9P7KHU9_9AGAR|nr:hypothetical protein DXG03_007141 [Asterophora parasitica]
MGKSTIEVVVSTLFMLKIFLNTLLSPVTPWWRPIQADVAPLMALSISAVLGLGNLVNCKSATLDASLADLFAAVAFSETTLGRFLRALEMYILILFVMITAFYKVPSEPSRASNDPEKSFIRISEMPQPPLLRANPQRLPPLIISSSIIPRRLSVPANNHERSRRSRHSSWVIPRNSDQRTSGANRVYVEDGGIGTGPAEVRFVHTGSPSPIEEMQKAQVAAEINAEADDTDVHEQLTVSKIPSFTGISISSYYGMERFSNTQYMPPPPGVVARDTDSPVYGLNGIMARIQGQGKLSRPHRSISFSDLLRQQTELDKSIAALRLFSSDDATSALIIPSPPPTASLSLSSYVRYGPKQSKDDSTGSYFGRKPDSASNRSDFSLSIFPEPPAVENELPASTKLERLVGRAQTLRRERTESSQMIPINVTGDDGPLLPASPTQFEGSLRLESAGTQYDATSFIGGESIYAKGLRDLT